MKLDVGEKLGLLSMVSFIIGAFFGVGTVYNHMPTIIIGVSFMSYVIGYFIGKYT